MTASSLSPTQPLAADGPAMMRILQRARITKASTIRVTGAAGVTAVLWLARHGYPPLGYDPPEPGSRTLRVNAEEAAKVRLIFERYLALGSVHKLQLELEKDGVFSKRHVTAAGRSMGGLPFSRGALFTCSATAFIAA